MDIPRIKRIAWLTQIVSKSNRKNELQLSQVKKTIKYFQLLT
uniref:Uncharacterized protein n=1 Tax=Arundo donax TaxID=35708 RepID=A0A0A8ZLY6_ARUDO